MVKKYIGIRIEEETREMLQERSKKEFRTVSDLIRKIIREERLLNSNIIELHDFMEKYMRPNDILPPETILKKIDEIEMFIDALER